MSITPDPGDRIRGGTQMYPKTAQQCVCAGDVGNKTPTAVRQRQTLKYKATDSVKKVFHSFLS